MIKPPPPLGDLWTEWGERLNTYLVRFMNRIQFKQTDDSASDDGVFLWDREINQPVVSYNNEWVPLAYSYNSYGAFYTLTTQAATTINTATAITWGNTAVASGVSVDSVVTSRINFSRAGTYEIHFSAEMHSESSSAKTMYMWPRINGTDVPGSTMVNVITANNQRKTVSRSGLFQVESGDYLEAMFAVDDLDLDLHGIAATAFCPASPSVTLVITEVTV